VPPGAYTRSSLKTAPASRAMRAAACAALAVLSLAVFGAPRSSLADVDLFNVAGEPVYLTANIRVREEVWNWFDPGKSAGSMDNNQYQFLGGFSRWGLGYKTDGVTFYGELMSPYLLHLPDNSLAPAPQGALGLGANYYQIHMNPYDASVFLKQGFLAFDDVYVKGLHVKGGRLEFGDGAEFMPAKLDPQLKWIVLNRIQQRLIGNFGFSDIQRSFDGAVVSYGRDRWQVTAMYGVPTKGVFDLQGMDEIKNTDVIYAALNARPAFSSGDSLARLFYIYYDDGRGIPKVSNTAFPPTSALTMPVPDTRPIDIHTVGVDFVRVLPIGPGTADFLVWGAGQLGAWGHQSQESWAAVGEMGYRLSDIAWKPWLRLGYTTTSGDGNPSDNTHGTFFQILPTARIYAQFPFYNLMNIDDASAQLLLAPLSRVQASTSLHGLWLSSSNDLWYSGGGEFDNKYFGYAGRPSFGHSYLATVLDADIKWTVDEHFATDFYYAHAFGGSVINAIYPASKQANYGFIEATIAF
jgi:Alginate export